MPVWLSLALVVIVAAGACVAEYVPPPVAVSPCPPGWQYVGLDTCYQAVAEPHTFVDASRQCANLGGVVATIRSPQQSDAAAAMCNMCFVGLTRLFAPAPAGGFGSSAFTWLSGDEAMTAFDGRDGFSTPMGGQDCTALSSSSWMLDSCGNTAGVVCERPSYAGAVSYAKEVVCQGGGCIAEYEFTSYLGPGQVLTQASLTTQIQHLDMGGAARCVGCALEVAASA